MRKYVKLFAIILSIIIILAVALPFLFKDRIVTGIKSAINSKINGQVEFKNASVSLFTNFPKLTLSIEDLSCKSFVNQDTTDLFKAKDIELGFNLWALITDREHIKITKLNLYNPVMHVIAYDSLLANYSILKETPKDSAQSSGKVSLDIEEYNIKDGEINYTSNYNSKDLKLKQINHNGSIQVSNQTISLKSKTDIQEISYEANHLTLMKSIHMISNMDLLVASEKDKVTIQNFDLNLNNLKLRLNGVITSIGDSLLLDLNLNAPDNEFKDLFSLLPNAYTSDFKNVKSNGKFLLDAKINGLYNGKLKIYPLWTMNCKVDNGMLQYPGKSIQLENFKLNFFSENKDPEMKTAFVDLKEFSFLLNKQPFAGNIQLTNLADNYHAFGNLNGILYLSDVNDFYPLEKNTRISGILNPVISFKLNKSAISNKQYDQIDLSGKLTVSNLLYQTKGQPDIAIPSALLNFNPNQLEIKTIALKFGHSDMEINGMINEPLNFFEDNQSVKGQLNARSNLLDLKEWTVKDSQALKTKKTAHVAKVPVYISKLNLDINCNLNQIIYEDYDIKSSTATGVVQGNSIVIRNFNSTINGNQLAGSGNLSGVYSFMMDDQILEGNLHLNARQFDADRFMTKSPVSSASKQVSNVSGPFMVPEKFNLKVDFKAGEVYYKPMTLKNATGNLVIVNKEIQFQNLNANIGGGKIGLQGIYNTSIPNKPHFNLKFDILKLQFAEALNSFESFKKLAPVMQYIQGFFNTNLIVEGILGKDNFPILDNMNVDGLFETLEGAIHGFKPLDLLSDKLKISELKNLNIKNTKNWVSVKNGIVAIKDLNKKIDDIDISVNGSHKISGNMDYQFVIKIPKNKVSKFASSLKLDHTVDQLNSILSKSGLGTSVLTNLNLLVNMTGTSSNPSFSFKLLNDKGDITSPEDQIKESVKSKIEDTLRSKFESEKAKVTTAVKKAEDSLRNEAEKKAGELKTQILDKAAGEATKKLDSTIVNKAKESLDTLSQKVLNKDVKKEADQIKDKLKDWNPFKKDKK
jgi:hypothetical protein